MSISEDWNLSKFLSTSGIASRRQAAELVKDGLVSINGEIVTNPGRRVTLDDEVLYRGKRVTPVSENVYVMLNKPRGYVCTNDDIHAAKKALDLIPVAKTTRLFSAGRLDKNSEGLILFSNDGDFVAKLTHPRNRIVKTYEVSVERSLSEQDIRSFLIGIRDAGEVLKAIRITPLSENKYLMMLGEGKNREIRRMIAAVGNETRRLKRVAVGKLRLGSLPTGQWRYLTTSEINAAILTENGNGIIHT